MKIKFLLDENLSSRLKKALFQLNPNIDILRVGDADTPSLETDDQDILLFAEVSRRILITKDRKSMPEHLRIHWDAGRHIWGLLWIRPEANIRDVAEYLYLMWEVYESEELIDFVDWIP